MTTIAEGSLVAVTGLNGYVGSHVADQLLERGYAVRGTVRSPTKGDAIKESLLKRHPGASLEYVIVEDFSKPGAYDTALEGCTGVVHVASDLSLGGNPHEVVTPTVNGVKGILLSAQKAGTVKRFVFTSSVVAIYIPPLSTAGIIDCNTWNDACLKEAWEEPFGPENALAAYSASKTAGEKEVWKFAEQDSSFIVNTVVPNYVGGEIINISLASSSGAWLYNFYSDPENEQYRSFLDLLPSSQHYVDVKDTAKLHVAGLIMEDVQNRRLLAMGEKYNSNIWMNIFRKLDPKKKWPEDRPGLGEDPAIIEKDFEIEILKRFGQDGFTPMVKSLKTCVESK